jgi:hypothetical protein
VGLGLLVLLGALVLGVRRARSRAESS